MVLINKKKAPKEIILGSVEYFVFLSEFKNQFSSLYVIFLA
jgi:hypothetical protein